MDPLHTNFHEHHEPKPKSFFHTLPPKSAFWLGVISSILVIGTLGFIILGSIMLSGNANASGSTKNTGNVVAKTTDTTSPNTKTAGAVPVVNDDDHIRGSKDAPITIIEYSDFECPFCSRFHPTMQQVMADFDGQVRWIYRHFPLSFHPWAEPAANASECAGEQGKFWEFADALFENQSSLGDDLFKKLASDFGLNRTTFDKCVTDGKYLDKVRAQLQGGSTAGITGTPGSFIIDKNGSAIPIKGALPYESIASGIQELLDS